MENKKINFLDIETDLVKSITDCKYKDVLNTLHENGWWLKDYRVYVKSRWKYKDVVDRYICFLFCKEDRGIFVEVTRYNPDFGEVTRYNPENDFCTAATVLSADQKLDQEKIESVFKIYVNDELHIE